MAQTHTPPSTYILRDLHDVAVPESVSWWPQTTGWKIFAVLCFVLFLYGVYRFVSHWWKNRYRSEAIQAIAQLQVNDANDTKQLFSILKIVLIYLDNTNAPLFDEQFLKKLDELNPNGVQFNDDISTRWVRSVFNPNMALESSERKLLMERAINWVNTHDNTVKKPSLINTFRQFWGEKNE